MSITIQAHTLQGHIIEAARWECVPKTDIREGQSIHIVVPTDDVKIARFVAKNNSQDCTADMDEDKNITLSLYMVVKNVRHMLDTSDLSTEALAVIIPANRNVENVLLYIIAPKQCDPKFIRTIRETS